MTTLALVTAFIVAGFTFAIVSVGAQTNAGTVKIFDGDKELPANDPKVCGPFTVQGLGFEAGETVEIAIVGHGGPNAGTGSFDATVMVADDGTFATEPITLPDGMYKLDSEDGEGGGDKNKVFKVECAPVTPPTTPTTTTTPAPPTPGGQTVTPPTPEGAQVSPEGVQRAPGAVAAPVQVQPRTTG